MKILAILHSTFETLGVIETWAKNNHHHVTVARIFRGEPLPEVAQFDSIISLGGPQSALQLHHHPYLVDEVAYLEQAIKQDKTILGICLGAQLIAESLGAKTQPSPIKEVGVYPIRLTDAGKADPIFSQFPAQFDVAHWHTDMPGIPKQAVLLAESNACPHQAFRYKNKVYALQFHLELTRDHILAFSDNCTEYLSPGQYTQHREELLKQDYNAINKWMHLFLDQLFNHA